VKTGPLVSPTAMSECSEQTSQSKENKFNKEPFH